MIRYVYFFGAVGAIIIFVSIYGFLRDKELVNGNTSGSSEKYSFEVTKFHKNRFEKKVPEDLNTKFEKKIPKIQNSKKISTENILINDTIPTGLTYNPLLNKAENIAMTEEDFAEAEKYIRNDDLAPHIHSDIPYEDPLPLEEKYTKKEKLSNKIEFSSETLKEYEKGIVFPENEIYFEDKDKNLSSIASEEW